MNSRSNSMSMFVMVALLLKLTMLVSGSSFKEEELYHDESYDLVQLRYSLSSPITLYFNWTGRPCNNDQSRWIGISCSNSKVVGIALAGLQLTGSLPSTALQSLWYLTYLDLSDNALHGTLPTLQGLIHLRAVSFARNRFSGSIPTDFLALPNLSQLELEDNVLNGTIPPFDQQALTVFNVSNNFLEGRIPDNSVMQGFPRTSFAHNLELCGKPLDRPCSSAPPASRVPPTGQPPFSTASSSTKRLRSWILALVSICAVAVAFMLVFGFLYYLKRRTKKAKQKAYDSESFAAKEAKCSESIPEAKKTADLMFFDKEKATFDLDDLMRSSAEEIGKGELGSTYKATLESGRVVVVKRLKNMLGMSKKEFVQQMQLLGRKLRHENLVEIISFHYSKEEKLVIYEYVPGGSLFQLLHDDRGEERVPLKWAARLYIVRGIARGLAYLHQCLPSHKVPHANLKSSNILIVRRRSHCAYYHPKLTDSGFQPVIPSSHIHKLAIGKVPEFTQGKKLTHKADVYCFGLILLEVITGQAPIDGEEDLPGWVKLVVNNDWSTDILDLEIVAEKESHADMLKLTEIALECTDSQPERRPTMSDVVKRIEEIRAANNEGRRSWSLEKS